MLALLFLLTLLIFIFGRPYLNTASMHALCQYGDLTGWISHDILGDLRRQDQVVARHRTRKQNMLNVF
jgi:hypothetical protein